MLIKQYAAFVSRTDAFSKRPDVDPRSVAIYGLASEIGSIVSAIKKQNLQEGGALSSPIAREELKEELGDAMWYAFALARIEDDGKSQNILRSDIDHLRDEIGKNDARGARIRKVLTDQEVEAFFESARAFEELPHPKVSDYQALAFRTARTDGETLLTVCAAVLTQLGAQLMRHLLPDVEIDLNRQLQDRSTNVVLGEIAWHLCAIASLYTIDMDEVAQLNVEKASARERRENHPTPLHDEISRPEDQLPRKFVIEFRSIEDDVSQMYWNGQTLGDPLRDQHSERDGYRFHDVMHLANAACLGWSPVLRDLMRIKRDGQKEVKDAQDTGRSAVVEELVVKYIHWEASRRAKMLRGDTPAGRRPLFAVGEDIPFSVVKQARAFTQGHEVYANRYWEWEKSIREGYRVFQSLREHKSGRVYVDLETRSLRFEPLPETGQ